MYQNKQKKFQVRINQAKRLNITPSLDEKIQLYNMTEEVLWGDLDRYVDNKLEIEICINMINLQALEKVWVPVRSKDFILTSSKSEFMLVKTSQPKS